VAIAESKAIEQYLAQKFNCLGKNTYERSLIASFVSSTGALWDDILITIVQLNAPPEVKQQQMEALLKTKLPNWIKIHEQHLQANGNNGHYVGDTVKRKRETRFGCRLKRGHVESASSLTQFCSPRSRWLISKQQP
jgi:hypothetical protein